MPANECIPYKEPGSAITFKATAAVAGKRFVKPSGNRTGGPGLSTDLANVYQCAQVSASGDPAVGVSKYDVANGALGGAHTGGIVPVTCGANVAAGDRVMSDANGKAIPYAAGNTAAAGAPLVIPRVLGIAMTGAVSGADAEIMLSL